MMEEGVNFPLGCSEEGEKRRKSTAGRNLSDLGLIFFIHDDAFFQGKVRLSRREQEVILKHTLNQSRGDRSGLSG